MATHIVVLIGLVTLAAYGAAYDSTILTDFGLPNATSGDNFTYRGFEAKMLPADPADGGLGLAPAFAVQFPGLHGLGISSLFFKLGAGALVPPHLHTRATEIFFVITGTWSVGFIDSRNKLFHAELKPGDQFVFPVGMIHYQLAVNESATAYAAFNSQNPGLTLIASNLFTSTPAVPDEVLSRSFALEPEVIMGIKKALTG